MILERKRKPLDQPNGWHRAVKHHRSVINGSTNSSASESAIKELLAWLEVDHSVDLEGFAAEVRVLGDGQRGLFAQRDIFAHELLLRIPASALINQKTLKGHYADADFCSRLSSFQLVSLHLARWRDSLETSPWDPFLRTMPEDYQTMPLRHLHEVNWKELLGLAPYAVELHWRKCIDRFERDWDAARRADDQISREAFIWAWLTVNSRCAHYDLGQRDPNDNATLMPIIDMANHTSDGPNCRPFVDWKGDMLLRSCDEDVSFASTDVLLRTGQEICFTYGRHGNHILLVDYGFFQSDNQFDEVQVGDLFWQLLMVKRGAEADKLRSLLQEYGYEGGYTISGTGPPVPDYRLQVALGLLATRSIDHWKLMVQGEMPDDFSSNSDVATALEELKRSMCAQAVTRLKEIALLRGDDAFETVKSWIAQLWERVEKVAENVTIL